MLKPVQQDKQEELLVPARIKWTASDFSLRAKGQGEKGKEGKEASGASALAKKANLYCKRPQCLNDLLPQ